MRRFWDVGGGRAGQRLVWVASVAAVGSLSGCASDGPLREGVPRGAGITNTDATRSHLWTFGDTTCLERSERVVLDGLEAHVVGEARVTRTAVRIHTPGKALIGHEPGRLPADLQDVEGFVVEDAECDDNSYVELAVEVVPDTRRSSGIDGMTLRYHVGDKKYEASTGVVLALCVGNDTGNGEEILADCGEEEDVPNTSPPPTTTF